MNIGDRVRLKSSPPCRDVLGLTPGQVGIVKCIDATSERQTILISFPDGDVYTSALHDYDFEILSHERCECAMVSRVYI